MIKFTDIYTNENEMNAIKNNVSDLDSLNIKILSKTSPSK